MELSTSTDAVRVAGIANSSSEGRPSSLVSRALRTLHGYDPHKYPHHDWRESDVTLLFCGIDWAETHHDVAIIDDSGRLVAKKRVPDDPSGFTQLVELLAEAGDCAEHPVPVAIETPRGLLVSSLRATRPAGVCDQPTGGGPVSGTPLGGTVEVRSR